MKKRFALVASAAGFVIASAASATEPGPYLGDRTEEFDPKKDLRAAEYLPGADADRFGKHEGFFAEELVAWAGKEFGDLQAPRDFRQVAQWRAYELP